MTINYADSDTIKAGEDFIAHFGVKGMRWGIRHPTDGVPRATDRMARKDAEEHARAKLYFGDGAGTRRKLSKATVNARKAADPAYAKAFDAHLANQDLSLHATKAVSERKSTDRKVRNKQRAGYAARRITGERGTQAAISAAIIGGGVYLSTPQGQAMMRRGWNTASTVYKRSVGARRVRNFIKNYS